MSKETGMIYDVAVVGAGPAGMTAAVYALRAGRSVLLLDGEGFGGQITQSARVENYPGAPDVNGYDLAETMLSQVRAFGGELTAGKVEKVTKTADGFRLVCKQKEYEARTVIAATGLRRKKLGIPGEDALIGRGVSFCAVCDGRMFRGREVLVVGGGNTAVEDALTLAQFCSRVTLIHRRDTLRAEAGLCRKMRQNEKIVFLPDTVVKAFLTDPATGLLSSARLWNSVTGEETTLPVSGAFLAVGNEPQNGAFSDLCAVPNGYLAAGEDTKTGVPGLFAAGDCRDKTIRQLTTAVADGTVAALAADAYLKEREHLSEEGGNRN